MKVGLLYTGSGPIAIVTSLPTLTHPILLEKLAAKGITKFIGYEVPVDLARERYGNHFAVVLRDLAETDDLRVLDYNGQHVFQLFSFKELGRPIFYEHGEGYTPM